MLIWLIMLCQMCPVGSIPLVADRHPISTKRERADSRSRRARGLPDRSYSPPGRARGGPRARERGDVSVSPNRDG